MTRNQHVSLEWMIGLGNSKKYSEAGGWDLIMKGLENQRNLQALSLSSDNCKCLGSMTIQKTCAWHGIPELIISPHFHNQDLNMFS